jgi:regulatory protein
VFNEKAFEKALDYLEMQDRTEAEVRARLLRAGFDEDDIGGALAKLRELRLIDDADYAVRYLAALRGKGRGSVRIRSEMLRKGLPEELVRFTIEDGYGRDDELMRATQVAENALSGISPGLPPEKKAGKIALRLKSRGFSYDVMSEVMSGIRKKIREVDVGDVPESLERIENRA